MSVPDIAISYTRDLAAQARRLTDYLAARGYSVWADFLIPPGAEWQSEIAAGLRAPVVVILSGPGGGTSPWIEREWTTAVERSWSDPALVLLPVIFDGAPTPAFLRSWAAVHVRLAQRNWPLVVLRAIENRRGDVTRGKRRPDQTEFLQRLDELSDAAVRMSELASSE